MLNEIYNELSKPLWWFSVVLAGIGINLLSAYLKKVLDTSLSSASSWWRNRSERQRTRHQALVAQLRANPFMRQDIVHIEFRLRLASMHLLLLGVLMVAGIALWANLAGPNSFDSGILRRTVLAATALIMMISAHTFESARRMTAALYEAGESGYITKMNYRGQL